MIRHPRRTARLLRRSFRPAVALLLVLAQGVAAFGFPLVRPRAGVHAGACGCDHTGGPASGCCCGTGACAIPAPEPAPASKPACPRCRDEAPARPGAPAVAAAKPTVTWVAAWQAQKCRGEGPLGLTAESPAVPPVVPQAGRLQPAPTGVVRLVDRHPSPLPAAPLDPPPRVG